jgi:hypothetical protein
MGNTFYLRGGSDGAQTTTSYVRGWGAVVVVINSDRWAVFGIYFDGTVLVAEARFEPKNSSANTSCPSASESRTFQAAVGLSHPFRCPNTILAVSLAIRK